MKYHAIKNIYRKNSSMVGAAFFVRSVYKTVRDVNEEINRRNLLVAFLDKKAISLSTVSKALKTLEDDLIIAREDNIRLLQADKLQPRWWGRSCCNNLYLKSDPEL